MFGCSVKMKGIPPPSSQIHHMGTDHWITSVQDTEDDQVILFDSSQGFSPRLSRSLEMQLFAIYGRVVHPRVQQQHSGVECGIFAIAYATEFVFNQYTGNELEFDRFVMRDHLLMCFQNQDLIPFPKLKRKMKLKLKNRPQLLESTTIIISR